MKLKAFPEDMISGAAWAEQIGAGYTLFNPVPAMTAAANVAMLMPTIAMGTMMGIAMGTSRTLGLPHPDFDEMTAGATGDPSSSARRARPSSVAATVTRPKRSPGKTPAVTFPKAATVAAASTSRTVKSSSTRSGPARTAGGNKTKAIKRAAGPQRPPGLEVARDGVADDLKRISGIGPKLELVLNDLGIYHFDQIVKWTSGEIDWMDDYLKFKGRIVRDKWLEQAGKFVQEA